TVVVTSITILLLRPSLENGGVITQQPGPITSLIQAITGQTGLDIMKDPKCFRAVYQVTGIWETAGYGSIVYFAAILGISPTNYEAARIDGASKMQQIRYVTIPGMTATLVIMLILDIGKLLTIGYEKVILLQGTNSDVLFETAETISTYVWHMNLGTGVNKAAGAAADMLNSVISMLLVIGSNQIARKVSSTSLY
ncbi:MAG: ABC transporter permease subunit, partial [Bacilli bacterium]|nr:ABC transporter permease subunit [Bacilli bacterium]